MEDQYPPQDTRHWSVAIADIMRDRRTRSTKLVYVVASLVLLIAASYAAFLLYDSGRELRTFGQNQAISDLAIQVLRSRSDIEEIRKQTAVLTKTLTDLRTGSQNYASLEPQDRQALNEVIAGQKNLDERLKGIEDAIRIDTTKAIAIPMLRYAVDALQERERTDLSLLQSEIGRLYSLAQWFMALMVTIILGVFTLALSNLLKKEPLLVEPTKQVAKQPKS
jgi:uncharacterized coiled-coil protein SlyX